MLYSPTARNRTVAGRGRDVIDPVWTLHHGGHHADRHHGRLSVLVLGEAGIGKSRLLSEAAARARRRGLVTLSGRAVEGGGTYRAVAEALSAALRDDRLVEREEVRPFRAALGRLIPGWARPGDAPSASVDPAVVVGEGVLRVLRLLDGTAGCWSSKICIGPTPTRWRCALRTRRCGRTTTRRATASAGNARPARSIVTCPIARSPVRSLFARLTKSHPGRTVSS